jgi:hypothetical protein
MVTVLAAAYGADRLAAALRQQVVQTLSHSPWLWLSGVINLVLAGLLFGLAWLALTRPSSARRPVASVYLVIGLLVTFALALRFTFSGTLLPLGLTEYLTPDSRTVLTAAFISVVGAAGLLTGAGASDRKTP